MADEGAFETYVGFDSAWTDNPKAPGAICALVLRAGRPVAFHAPQLASFVEALAFVNVVHTPASVTFVALDQPTIVPNATSLRPVERAAASLISWLGGGVQPSNRGRKGMFCDASPIWSFLSSLAAREAPEEARTATSGLYVMEVFPALALPSLAPEFFGRLAAPRYNPSRRKTFKHADWQKVAAAATQQFDGFGFAAPAAWCRQVEQLPRPRKADQDRLDAMICLLIALHWRLRDRGQSLLLGSLKEGYMVLPASAEVRSRLEEAARRAGVNAL
ncbi:DUF429 domain-containing protein [Paracoccus actinidiae]|uniref:DUF429 domain-containing protein n=1 Tax=Paracoccus actinidiae TaxID=3064531 RepID=UPI0027D30548|nr:DUF429 domain-containing protein [Paracoccus sp. M09]